MLFITNRAVKRGYDGDTEILSFYNDDSSANIDAYFCERHAEGVYTELGHERFFNALKKHEAKQILFFIHGYSNLPESHIFPRVQLLQKLCDDKEPGLIKVVPLIWPCDDDFGALKDYYDDQKSADMSAFAFGRVLEMFSVWGQENARTGSPCMKRINVLAHSMGNRVLRGAINNWGKYHRNYKIPILFRNTFLVAADVVNETLESDKSGRLIPQCSRNVTVYHASDDLALRASKITNLKNMIASRRLGHTGPENLDKVAKNVYSVDCDDVNNRYDYPGGHSYFLQDKEGRSGTVFNHIFNSIKTGRVSTLGMGRKDAILRDHSRHTKEKI